MVPLLGSAEPRVISGLGCTSVEAFRGRASSISPLCPYQYLPFLRQLSIFHPLVSQAVKLVEAFANRGHSVVFDVAPENEQLLARCEQVLESFQRRVYERGGIDGLINALIAELCVTGAVSREDIIRPGVHVERIAIVPPEDVEFLIPTDESDGDFKPHQRGRTLKRLDDRTYRYMAWRTFGGNPYAIPPFVAAINDILRQMTMSESRDAILAKLGWLGLLTMEVPLRDRDKESSGNDNDEIDRARTIYLQQLATAFAGNFRDKLMLLDPGMRVELQASPTQNMSGVQEMFDSVEAQIFSGLGLDPSLFGRSWAKAETWVAQSNSTLEDVAGAARRIVGGSLERSLALEFALHGLPVTPWVQFASSPKANPGADAAAEQQKWSTTLDQLINGMIDETTAAQIHGFDSWHDVTRIPADQGFDIGTLWSRVKDMLKQGAITPQQGAEMLGLTGWADESKISSGADDAGGGLGGFGFRATRFRFDRRVGRYRHERPRLTLAERAPQRAAIAKASIAYFRKVAKDAKPRRRYARGPGVAAVQRMARRFAEKYAGALGPDLQAIQDELFVRLKDAIGRAPEGQWSSGDEFGKWAIDQMQEDYSAIWRGGRGGDVLANVVKTHEEIAAAWTDEARKRWAADQIPKGDGEVTAADASAFARGDAHHMSIYLKDMSGAEREAMQRIMSEEFDQAGSDITDPDVMDALMNRMEREGAPLLKVRPHGREEPETNAEALARMPARLSRIVETSVMRSYNVSELRTMALAEIGEYEIRRVGSEECPICGPLEGTVVSVGDANAWLDEFLALSPEEQEEMLTSHRKLSPEELQAIPGATQPPLHPHCLCQVEAVL